MDASCQSGGTASVLFGDGAGAFKAGTDVALGNNPSSIALANIRGSGVLDLLVSRGTDNTVAILPGAGNGTFKTAVPYAVGNAPGALSIADFNGDGQPDVAVANTADSTVSVLFGNSDGTLQTAFSVPVSGNPAGLTAIGAGSGRASLATANGSPSTLVSGSNVTVLPNLKPQPMLGTNAPTVVLTASPNPSSVNQAVLLTATVTGTAGVPTGTVTFNSNGTAITDCTPVANPVTLDLTGVATCTTSSLPASSAGNSLTADYSGDPTVYNTGTSNTVSQVVTALTPTITITPPSPASPQPLNTPVTFTASLTGATLTPVTPAGKMTFLLNSAAATCVGAASNAITVIAAGTAACQIANMPIGTANVVSASYSGDTNFVVASSASAPNYTITKSSPTITVAASNLTPSPSALNSSVTFIGTLGSVPFTPIAPGGTVAFYLNGSSTAISGCATVTPDPTLHTANCVTSSMPGGINSIVAVYAGDSNFNGATSSTLNYTVNAAARTISFAAASPASPQALGTAVTFTAQLSGTLTPVLPAGSMTFLLNGSAATCNAAPSNVITVNSTGSASCVIQNMPAGTTNVVSATYTGDTSYTVATAGSAPAYTITAATRTISFAAASPASPQAINTAVTFTAQLSGTFTPTLPTGNMTFLLNGSAATCVAAPSNVITVNSSGAASCVIQNMPAGTTNVVSATYAGDTNYTAAAAGSAPAYTITAAARTVSFAAASPASPQALNTAVTFTAQLSGTLTPILPTGSMTFLLNGSAATCVAAPSNVITVNSTGSASCVIQNMPAGTTNVVSATYAGDTNYTAAAAGSAPAYTITAAAV